VLNTTPRPLHCHEIDTVDPSAGVGVWENSRLSGIRSRTVQSIASRYTAYATQEKREKGSKIRLPKEQSSFRLTIWSEATRWLLLLHNQAVVRLRFDSSVMAHWSYDNTRAIRPTLKVYTLTVNGSSTWRQ